MQKTVPFLMDHFGIGTYDAVSTTSFLEGLGFTTGATLDGATSFESSQFMFDNCYLEVDKTTPEHCMPSPGRPVEVKDGPGIYVICASNRDIDKAYEAVSALGIALPEIARGFSRPANHGENKGEAVFNAFFFQEELFNTLFFGVVNHATKELIHQKGRYLHKNGVNKVSSLVLYYDAPEKIEAAEKDIRKIEAALSATADTVCRMDTFRIVDKNAYQFEFGTTPPTIKSVVAAATFKDGDKQFLREKAGAMKLHNFDRDGKLYIDARKETGMFLIFE